MVWSGIFPASSSMLEEIAFYNKIDIYIKHKYLHIKVCCRWKWVITLQQT